MSDDDPWNDLVEGVRQLEEAFKMVHHLVDRFAVNGKPVFDPRFRQVRHDFREVVILTMRVRTYIQALAPFLLLLDESELPDPATLAPGTVVVPPTNLVQAAVEYRTPYVG